MAQKEARLSCPSCSLCYTISDRCPKILGCLHTVCLQCLAKEEQNGATKFECPVCGLFSPLPTTGVSSLISNFALLDMLEVSCDLCEDPAVQHCDICQENLCPLHFSAHSKSKKTKDHPTIETGLFKQNEARSASQCAVHAGEEMKLYCPICDVPICRDCALSEDHVDHTRALIPLASAFSAKKAELSVELDQTRLYSTRLEHAAALVRQVEENVTQNQIQMLAFIEDTFQRVFGTLQARKEALLHMVDHATRAKVEALRKQFTHLNLTRESLTQVCDEVEALWSADADFRALSLHNLIKKHLKSIMVQSPFTPVNSTPDEGSVVSVPEVVDALEPAARNDLVFEFDEKIIQVMQDFGQVTREPVCAPACIASGEGLKAAKRTPPPPPIKSPSLSATSPSSSPSPTPSNHLLGNSFIIHAHDRHGRLCNTGGEIFNVGITLLSPAASQHYQITQSKTHRRKRPSIRSQHSDSDMPSNPSEDIPAEELLDDAALDIKSDQSNDRSVDAVLGDENPDHNDESLHKEDAVVSVSMQGLSLNSTQGVEGMGLRVPVSRDQITVTDQMNGTYEVEYFLPRAVGGSGWHCLVSVTLYGSHIAGSPFLVPLAPAAVHAQFLGHISGLKNPHGIAFDGGSDQLVYVSDASNNRICVFRRHRLAVTPSPDSGFQPVFNLSLVRCFGELGSHANGELHWPTGIAIDTQQQMLYIADSFNHRICVFTREGQYVRSFGSRGSGDGKLYHPSGVALDREGHLWVADSANHRLVVFTRDGRFLCHYSSVPILSSFVSPSPAVSAPPSPSASDVPSSPSAAQPSLLAPASPPSAHPPSSARSRSSSAGESAMVVLPQGQHNLCSPTGIAFCYTSPGGYQVLVAEKDAHRVSVLNYDPEHNELALSHTFGQKGSGVGGLKHPQSVTVDAFGQVWVADFGNGRVAVYRIDGELVRYVGSTGQAEGQLMEPASVALDDEGQLWVSECGNSRVSIFQ
eukprot:TRINITY_DN2236_c0_g1_i3.p1 TRINITY_DN2236_c0_g1~~TRINITY_DN2236_c0_g1_i3.p1  ORF type:complete len:999 (-),score=308.28 TRINITY_DN2236_c0_g1_i3:57-2990(-)